MPTPAPVRKIVNLPQELNGGKVIDFQYTRSLNSLVSDWSAKVAGGTFTAGNTISFEKPSSNSGEGATTNNKNAMTDGYILRAYIDQDGYWQLSGKDAGVKLMRTLPLEYNSSNGVTEKNLPVGDAMAVIRALVNHCDMEVDDNHLIGAEGNLSYINARCLVNSTTCAEAIAELALYSGYAAYITNEGTLAFTKVNKQATCPFSYGDNVKLSEDGTQIDNEGYADYISVSAVRDPQEDDGEETETIGSSTSITTETFSGNFSGEATASSYYDDIDTYLSDITDMNGLALTGTYSISIRLPLNTIISSIYTIQTDDNTRIRVEENHVYNEQTHEEWNENDTEQYWICAYTETEHTITKTSQGEYHGEYDDVSVSFPFTETTTEVMKRKFDDMDFGEIGIPSGVRQYWDNVESYVKPLVEEAILKTTTRRGAANDPIPSGDHPYLSYTPPFDEYTRRIYQRRWELLHFKALICQETNVRYEARQIGKAVSIRRNNYQVTFDDAGTGRTLIDMAQQASSSGSDEGTQSKSALVTPSVLNAQMTTHWVPIYTYKITYTRYNYKDEPVFSVTYSWTDDGGKWYCMNMLHPLDNTAASEHDIKDWLFEKCYATFTQVSSSAEWKFQEGQYQSPWQYKQIVQKKKITYAQSEGLAGALIGSNIDEWYDSYRKSLKEFDICPFFNGGNCQIYALHTYPSSDTPDSGLPQEPNLEACHYGDGQPFPEYRYCARAKKAQEYAKKMQGKKLEADAHAVAMSSIHAVGSETTTAATGFDDYQFSLEPRGSKALTQEEAQAVASILAENILSVKQTKGVMKTISVPYDTQYTFTDGATMISYNWGELKTEYSYLETGDLPTFLGTNISNLSAWSNRRENIRNNKVILGRVTEIDDDKKVYTVMIQNSEKINCSSNVGEGISVDDTVVINRSGGIYGKGAIIAVL